MTEQVAGNDRHHRGARGITGALILIALGVAFLLTNLGIVSFNWWAVLRYWPVFLILIGLDLLLGRTALGSILVALVGLLMLGGVLFLASSDTATGPRIIHLGDNAISREIVEPLGGADRLQNVEFNLGAGSTNIYTLSDSANVVEGTYQTDHDISLNVEYDAEAGSLVISQEEPSGFVGTDYIGELDLGLTSAVAIDNLDFNFGAGDFTLDLSELDVNSISISGGVGSIDVILPAAGDYSVDVSTGIGEVVLTVPDGVEAQISPDTAITSVDVANRFEKRGEIYQSSGYEGASNRATVHVSAAIGSVRIK
jgi:hypothetical protein